MAVGQMGLAPDVFAAMTPAEFCYAWLGWIHREERLVRQAWERERWGIWVLTCLQIERRDRRPMCEMFPLPWESGSPREIHEPTMQERMERATEMKRCIRR